MWYKAYGYSQNPFEINPLKEKTNLIGYEKELDNTIYHISTGSILFIESMRGNGRTKFLKAVIDNFTGKIIYVDAEKLKKNLDIENLLAKKNGKIFSKLPENMILIIDNADELSNVNYERLKYFFDKNNLRSIVFAGNNFKKSKLPESVKHRIGDNVISLKEIEKDELFKIFINKLETNKDESLVDKETLEKVYILSNKNIKKTIKTLNLMAEQMAEHQDDKLRFEYLSDIEQIDEEDLDESMIDKDGNEIVKVGDYYRNPAKDIFCSNCGAIVTLDDTSCPECLKEFEVEEEVQ